MCHHKPKYKAIQHDPYGKSFPIGNCEICHTTLDIDFFICGICGEQCNESQLSGLYGKVGEPICRDCERRMKYLGG